MGMRKAAAALLICGALTAGASGSLIVNFDDGTGAVTGTIELVEIVQGLPVGGDTGLPGGVAPGAFDVTLIFKLTVDVGEVSDLGIGITDGVTPLVSTGAGWIPGGNVDITSISGTPDTREFRFDEGGAGAVMAGQMSDLMFVSYSSLALDGSLDLNFMITDSVPTFTVTVPLVPAPGVLVALGAGALCIGRRRRR
ncbi:MAG: PEP-CTERM sorting domain-containing protein [Planctomycetes bacterium]|nr:PEP-CTERM sorting domain-containing protein [Planctomycetota bacterium]